MTPEDRLAYIEALLQSMPDIDPTDPFDVGLLDERDELKYQLSKEQA